MGLYKGSVLIAGSLPIPPGAMAYKGSCLQADLPTSGQLKGDYYKLLDVLPSIYAGQCAIWNGSTWDYSSANINVDSILSSTSTNPVENKIIKTALDTKVDKEDGKGLFSGSYNDLTNKPTLFSGSYNDLKDKPALKTVATSGKYSDLTGLPALKTVATTGSYTDLINKPTIPVGFTVHTIAGPTESTTYYKLWSWSFTAPWWAAQSFILIIKSTYFQFSPTIVGVVINGTNSGLANDTCGLYLIGGAATGSGALYLVPTISGNTVTVTLYYHHNGYYRGMNAFVLGEFGNWTLQEVGSIPAPTYTKTLNI